MPTKIQKRRMVRRERNRNRKERYREEADQLRLPQHCCEEILSDHNLNCEVDKVEMDSKKTNGTTVKKESLLPISRIRIIMKSSPDTENIGQDSLFLVARSTELFVKYLTHKAYEMHKREKQKVLDYPSLADAVQTMESMAFLKEIMPRKITVKEYKEKLQHLDSDSNGEDSS